MRLSLEFILGRLDAKHPALVARDDFGGPNGEALRAWQRLGFLDSVPETNPVPTCPHCFAGTPYKLGDVYFCNLCHSEVDEAHLKLWRLDLEAFLTLLASNLSLRGDVERVDDGLWQLGMLHDAKQPATYFYLRGDGCSDAALRRLTTYRSALVLHGKADKPTIASFDGPILSLLEILVLDDVRLTVLPLQPSNRRGGTVRFDPGTGVIRAGEIELGRIPLQTREYWFVECLAANAGRCMSYADLKHHVGIKTGSRADLDEATFCQKLRSRLKHRHGVSHIDALIQSDRKGGGYTLRPTFERAA